MKEVSYYHTMVRTRISQLRKTSGLSERTLSLSVGKAHSYVQDLSKKKTLPSMKTFFLICEKLNVSPQDFFDEAMRQPSESRLIIEQLERLMDTEDLILHRMLLEQLSEEDVQALHRIMGAYSRLPAKKDLIRQLKKQRKDAEAENLDEDHQQAPDMDDPHDDEDEAPD